MQLFVTFSVILPMLNLFTPIYPTSPVIKEHVYCFYCYQTDDKQYQHIHYSLPHTYNAVSVYYDATLEFSADTLKATGNGSANYICALQGKRQSPLRIELNGSMKRVTIIFKPLGLNGFIKQPLSEILGENVSFFTAWESAAFAACINNLFRGNDISGQLKHLENFLGSVYQPISLPQLEYALSFLEDTEMARSMNQIASMVGLSLRSFNRLFRTHLGVSPVTHQRIAKFRQTLENRMFAEELKTLTQLSYESNFYDQSDFVKLYKQLAGSSPKTLFKNVQQVGDSKLFFQMLNPKFA